MKIKYFAPAIALAGIFTLSGISPNFPQFKIETLTANAQNIDLQGLMQLLFQDTNFTITGGYGQKLPIWCSIYWNCQHTGIDFAPNSGNIGAPIYSPIEGRVIRISNQYAAAGIYNPKANITFFFIHMDTILVKEGDEVKKGQQIGTVGNKGGISTGPHLHIDARRGQNRFIPTDVRTTLNPVDAVNEANK